MEFRASELKFIDTGNQLKSKRQLFKTQSKRPAYLQKNINLSCLCQSVKSVDFINRQGSKGLRRDHKVFAACKECPPP